MTIFLRSIKPLYQKRALVREHTIFCPPPASWGSGGRLAAGLFLPQIRFLGRGKFHWRLKPHWPRLTTILKLHSAGQEPPTQFESAGHWSWHEDLISQAGNSHLDPCDFVRTFLTYAPETVDKVAHSVP